MSAIPQPSRLFDDDRTGAPAGLDQSGEAARAEIRAGRWTKPTGGLGPGLVQANLVALPKALAADFYRFCALNPRTCPLLAASEPGDSAPPGLGAEIELKTDLPRYQIWAYGAPAEEVTDASERWRDDLVSFLIGSSLSFDADLKRDGIGLRHADAKRALPCYRTNLPLEPAGPFAGSSVVSMRPMPPGEAIRAIQISARHPYAHGAPIHIGDPAGIGIADLDRPDYGERDPVPYELIPVYWPSALSVHAALAASRPPFCITSAPGCLLVTGLASSRFAQP